MIKETCPHCNNIVVGEFTPSSTRKWLTTVAKKGGMKAVLATLGSVVPGFGSISGFVVGTGIDLIYGKDIDKLIDKVANIFQDKKVYVFNCPNCGKSWATTIRDGYEYTEEVGNDFDEVSKIFELITDYANGCIEVGVAGFSDIKKLDFLSEDFSYAANGILDILKDEYERLERKSEKYIDYYKEIEDLKSQIVRLHTDIITYIAQTCQGRMNDPVSVGESYINLPLSFEVHGVYPHDINNEKKMVVGIVLTGTVHSGDKIRLEQDEDAYVEDIIMFGRSIGRGEAGDVCAVIVPSYYIDEYDEEVYYEFPQVIYGFKVSSEGSNEEFKNLTEAEEEYIAEYKVCLEESATISNKEIRLLNRLRDSLGITPERGAELEAKCLMVSLSNEEKEYVAEVKACLAGGGSISDRERRLLTRIAKSLGISEERARELETTI